MPGGRRRLRLTIVPRALSGVGIGLRREHFDAVLRTNRRIDWLEIVAENFVGVGGRARYALDACVERWPIVPHGVALSLGGSDPLDDALVDGLARLCAAIDAPFFTEHACWSRLRGRPSHDLLPLPFTELAASNRAARSRALSDRLAVPIALENITYYATMPTSRLDEGAFLARALDEGNAGLLLDVNNVVVNAKNRGRDPVEQLLMLPLDRVRQIHVAGHSTRDGLVIDDHAGPVSDETMSLLATALSIVGPVPVLMEWDQRLPDLDVLLDEADRVRSIWSRAACAHPTSEMRSVSALGQLA